MSRSDVGACDRMSANGEKLEHRSLIEGHAIGLEHEGLRYGQILGHAAVRVHAQHLDVDAAVRLACAACDAVATGDVRHDVDLIASGDTGTGRGRLDDAGEFVAHYARIRKVGLIACEDVQIGAADAHTFDPQKHIVGTGFGNGPFGKGKLARLFANDGFHGDSGDGGECRPPTGVRKYSFGLTG